MGHEVLVEKDAGKASSAMDADYEKAGAKIVEAAQVYSEADVLLKVQSLQKHPLLNKHEADLLKEAPF